MQNNNSSNFNLNKSLLHNNRKTDFWDNLPQELKEDILIGITEIENGETVDYESFIQKHR